MRGGGVYVWRTRKPGSWLGLSWWQAGGPVLGGAAALWLNDLASPWWALVLFPFLVGRHFAYVGRTTSFAHRSRQHLGRPDELDTFKHKAKPWADLEPKMYTLRLPRWIWLHKGVEALLIWLLLPVYNVQLNKANPRRIKPHVAAWQRHVRQAYGLWRRKLSVYAL